LDPDRGSNARTRPVRVGGLRLERQFEVDFEHFVARDTEHDCGHGCGHESGVPISE
jgi:hypothetical protein